MKIKVILLFFILFQPRSNIPVKVISTINENIIPILNQQFRPDEKPPNWYKVQTNLKSSRIYKNRNLISTENYDDQGRLISWNRFQKNQSVSFGNLIYNSKGNIKRKVTNEKDEYYTYKGDSITTRTTYILAKREKEPTIKEFKIRATEVLTTKITRRDTFISKTILNKNGVTEQCISFRDSDTSFQHLYKYDTLNNLTLLSFKHQRPLTEKKRILPLCNRQSSYEYDNNGIVNKRTLKKQCEISDTDTPYQINKYNSQISFRDKVYKSKTTFMNDSFAFKTLELEFNQNLDVITKIVNDKIESKIDTFIYEYQYIKKE